jgi:hypothetical protein
MSQLHAASQGVSRRIRPGGLSLDGVLAPGQRHHGLFASFELSGGSVIAQSYRRHPHQELLRSLKLSDDAVPRGLDLHLHLVLDNYATHKTHVVRCGARGAR